MKELGFGLTLKDMIFFVLLKVKAEIIFFFLEGFGYDLKVRDMCQEQKSLIFCVTEFQL